MNTIPLVEQELPELFITVEPESQLKERGLKRIIHTMAAKHLPTVENTLHTHYGLKPYYCIHSSSGTCIPHEAPFFNVYVSRFVDFKALSDHLKAHGFYTDSRKVCFIDGYDANGEAEEEEKQGDEA